MRAVDAVERALAVYGPPVYVRHEIVHNKYVVESLKRKGAVFVRELDDVPDTAAPVIFSAHGVPKAVPQAAAARRLFAIDATCPLVTKVHREAEIHFKRGRHVILVGHAGHPEVAGTMGQLPRGAITLIETLEDVDELEPARSGRTSPTSRRRRCRSTTRARSSRPCGRAFPRSSARTRRTSATRPPTARRR